MVTVVIICGEVVSGHLIKKKKQQQQQSLREKEIADPAWKI